jgi:hypothetical protein
MPEVLVVCGVAFASKRLPSILRSFALPSANSLWGTDQGVSCLIFPEKKNEFYTRLQNRTDNPALETPGLCPLGKRTFARKMLVHE